MTTFSKKLVVLTLAAGAILSFSALTALAESGIAFSNNFASSIAEAKKSNKYVLVDFYTSWCSWCKVLDRKTFKDENFAKFFNQDFIGVRLDAEDKGEGQQLATENGISAYPTGLVFNSAGKLIGKIEGYKDPDGYQAALKKITHR